MAKISCILLLTFLVLQVFGSSEKYLQQMQNLLDSPKSFNLHKLSYPTAPRCNDGSASGYYLQKSASKHWIIYLQGGLFCFDSLTCSMRLKNSPDLTSSKFWPKTKEINGVLSNFPKISPFWNYNKVFIPYCSSDMWLGHGNRLSSGRTNFQFNGANILKAIFTELKLLHGMDSGKLVVSGTSAGAIGAVLNLNNLPVQPQKLILDSGWYLKNDENINSLDKMFTLLDVQKNYPQCRNSKNCLYAPDLLTYNRKLQILVVQFQYDTIQSGLDESLKNKDFVNYIRQQPVKIKRSFTGLGVSVFSPACEFHGLLESNEGMRKLTIGKYSLKTVIKSCFLKSKNCKLIDRCSFPNCNPTCPYYQENGFIQTPETLKKLGINLHKMARKNGFKSVKRMLYDISSIGSKKKFGK